MNKDFLIKLTNNLYRLTLLFPKKEPLRYKMRELADDILTNPLEENLEVLDSFFEVAKAQNWVSPFDILEIQRGYDNLKEGLKKTELEEEKREPVEHLAVIKTSPQSLPGRQEKILRFLEEKGKAQVWQLKQVFPEVTKRTLRRDFESLLNQGLIERIGERNETFYQPRGRT